MGTPDSTTDLLPEALRENLIRLIEAGRLELPVLPDAANQVISASFDEDCDLARLAEVIGRDPFMTGHVLRIANSALYGAAARIDSLQQALSRLGLARIREIAILVSCESRVFKVAGFDEPVHEMLRHSVATAAFSQEIARLRGWSADEAFLCGLLHDVGKPVLLQAIVDLKARMGVKARRMLVIPREDIEALAVEFHCEVGADLIGSWQLTPQLAEAVRFHHDPRAAPQEPQHAALVRIADDLAHLASGQTNLCEDDLRAHPANDPPIVALQEMESLLARREEIVKLLDSLG
ncbi:MAG: HDOD domain-containing protein [Planctomycetes bacterium]|nr:HDOD domain-containing protein [Planctomycetota bacterium]